jgi:hypothetical protein
MFFTQFQLQQQQTRALSTPPRPMNAATPSSTPFSSFTPTLQRDRGQQMPALMSMSAYQAREEPTALPAGGVSPAVFPSPFILSFAVAPLCAQWPAAPAGGGTFRAPNSHGSAVGSIFGIRPAADQGVAPAFHANPGLGRGRRRPARSLRGRSHWSVGQTILNCWEEEVFRAATATAGVDKGRAAAEPFPQFAHLDGRGPRPAGHK